MNVLFRVDSSIMIGTGHVMRCLVLADELKKHGAHIFFMCCDELGNVNDLITAKGYPVLIARTLLDCPVKGRYDWVIVDHYKLDAYWQTEAKKFADRIMVIDDLADRQHDCNLLLDQNFYRDMDSRYSRWVQPSCHQLLGPSYALLRPEFSQHRVGLGSRLAEVKQALVCFGGTDPTNETEFVLQALRGSTDQVKLKIITGKNNPHLHKISAICEQNEQYELLVQTSHVASVMRECDIAICSGGTLTWERYCMGLPALIITNAENQRDIARSSDRLGVDVYLGHSGMVTESELQEAWELAICNPFWISRASRYAAEMVDGLGVERVCNYLLFPKG
ncbi:UDP-2,4-diacetamido-2,4,6-trideoxy-beta-L-altropyranose hydrolase [Paenibacillus athensensis]|uniref:UDP-2,4-diacetamido-2,4, 6-trideoxy-beta-L-altropyranose hydrolase n=1 Tax=Paenibacillus athensensis TaxID=1967502 RepID=A0A4Y8Q4F0_9BACL|nr:UDP-2,4-diacetamido-2,4,6-trideoxy-beta-L-altropyranose hydrolase [Paenibacillus athensensis]MCD1260832.1 UDP-2,4-diacetamido-2,4,6-trideoxy-beta-L-altropyranose hydrolase [Paenibacillus athensensis]